MRPGFCAPDNPEFITGCTCSKCLSFPHCQYTASLDLDTYPKIFRSAIIGNYDCEKGLFSSLRPRQKTQHGQRIYWSMI